jgi:hypothetical protein
MQKGALSLSLSFAPCARLIRLPLTCTKTRRGRKCEFDKISTRIDVEKNQLLKQTTHTHTQRSSDGKSNVSLAKHDLNLALGPSSKWQQTTKVPRESKREREREGETKQTK